MNDYRPLPVQHLTGAVEISQPTPPKHVTMDSLATEVMTDLRCITAASIRPDATMETANNYMMMRGIRSLFVMNDDQSICGMITASDILGEKPLRFIDERRVKHSEILVQDIMTRLDNLEAIPIDKVEHAKVGNIVASLSESGRQHTLVIEYSPNTTPKICGIFSLTQIEKQLNIKITQNNVAKSFAEIETTLIAS
jgi:CBS-domain-containing membrane protein